MKLTVSAVITALFLPATAMAHDLAIPHTIVEILTHHSLAAVVIGGVASIAIFFGIRSRNSQSRNGE